MASRVWPRHRPAISDHSAQRNRTKGLTSAYTCRALCFEGKPSSERGLVAGDRALAKAHSSDPLTVQVGLGHRRAYDLLPSHYVRPSHSPVPRSEPKRRDPP